jgi:hypothetical protein
LATFPGHEDALWRLGALRQNLLRPELSAEVAETCEIVVKATVSSSPGPEHRALIAIVFAFLGENQELRRRMAPLFFRWLTDPTSFNFTELKRRGARLALSAEQPSLLYYLPDLLHGGLLSMDRDRDALRRFFGWVALWSPNRSNRARAFLAYYAGELEPAVSPIQDPPEPPTQLPG